MPRDKRLEPLSKYKSYSERDILENLSAKHPTGETLEDDLYYNMPEIRGITPESFKEPVEIKEGGVVNEKEEKTPTQVIKENTTKDAAKIFIEEKIKARNEQIKRKTGQNYFDFVNGGLAKSSKNKKVRGSGAAIKGVRSAKIS